jgi:RNA polymerase sigma factor (sigma-70 family)
VLRTAPPPALGKLRVDNAGDVVDLSGLVAAANAGDRDALVGVIEAVRDRVYHLSLRMTACPDDAQDATQEILIKVMTRLDTFRGDAAVTTWVHRIAVNHLLDRKRSAAERLELTFASFAADLHEGLSSQPSTRPDAELLAEQVRISCTTALLTCLDREHRVAYILGEVFELSSEEGAAICDVSPETFRKRLSRARQRVRAFVAVECGRVNAGASCHCSRRVDTAVRLGRVDPSHVTSAGVSDGIAEMERLYDVAGLMRARPPVTAPAAVTERIVLLIDSGQYDLLT